MRDVKFLSAVLLKSQDVWDVALCRWLNRYRRFESDGNVGNYLPNDTA
jgi:hypothetical protein